MTNFSFAVLISGNGSNLQAMIEAINGNQILGKICCVLSNKEDAYGLQRAKEAGIPTVPGSDGQVKNIKIKEGNSVNKNDVIADIE